jgi:hypothetical protein
MTRTAVQFHASLSHLGEQVHHQIQPVAPVGKRLFKLGPNHLLYIVLLHSEGKNYSRMKKLHFQMQLRSTACGIEFIESDTSTPDFGSLIAWNKGTTERQITSYADYRYTKASTMSRRWTS